MEFQDKLPIFWSQDRRTIRDLIAQDFACQHSQSQALDVKPIIVKTHCLNRNCSCILRDEGALIMKCIRQSGLVQAIWQKANTKSTQLSNVAQQLHLTTTEKPAHLIVSSFNTTWFEVLNEDGNSVPYWTVAKELVSFQPANFLVRKDLKVIFAKPINGSNNTFEIHTDNVGIVKSGTVLNFMEYNQFRVIKSRKLKEFMLIKCSNSIGQLLFIYPDEKCALSPVASSDNISGVHAISSVLQKFQLPISIRPVLGSLGSWLPSSERHFLRLNSSYFGDLIILEPLSVITGRFFIVTMDMLDDHLFSIGESESPYHFHLLDQNTRKIKQFLASCHPYESLRYLLSHLPNITNKLMTVCNCESEANTTPVDEEEVNQLMDEIEDIYFYVRTGKYPLPSRSRSVGNALGHFTQHRNSTMQPGNYFSRTEPESNTLRTEAVLSRSYSPPRGAVLMPSPGYQHTTAGPVSIECREHNSPPIGYPYINRFCSCQQLNHNMVPVDIQDSKQNFDSIKGSTSCDNLLQQNLALPNDYPSPPPLPPRLYNCVATPQSATRQHHQQYFYSHSRSRASTTIRRDGYAVVRKTQPLTFVH